MASHLHGPEEGFRVQKENVIDEPGQLLVPFCGIDHERDVVERDQPRDAFDEEPCQAQEVVPFVAPRKRGEKQKSAEDEEEPDARRTKGGGSPERVRRQDEQCGDSPDAIEISVESAVALGEQVFSRPRDEAFPADGSHP